MIIVFFSVLAEVGGAAAELCSAGQPRAAVPTWAVLLPSAALPSHSVALTAADGHPSRGGVDEGAATEFGKHGGGKASQALATPPPMTNISRFRTLVRSASRMPK